ncbi:hypothetical protein IQ264_29430, partial [Phormidium sp. LEGE 05292]|nr:hypothetical protein [Phormidium sp. LEGE 05292]
MAIPEGRGKAEERQKAEGRRQKAEGRRQKAEGKKGSKAEGRRKERQKVIFSAYPLVPLSP